jgi:hypothetical protein
MSSVPGVIGGPVAGTIQTGLRTAPEEGFDLTLRCIHRQSSSDSTRERILWQEEQRIEKEELFYDYLGMAARFSFLVPLECKESTAEDSGNRILWSLQVKAWVPGSDVGYDTRFELPVFRTEQSSDTAPRFAEMARAESDEEVHRLRQRSKIKLRNSPGGGTEILFPALRNPGMAASLTIFLAIWTGVVWLLVHLGTPLIFPILFGLFGLLIFYWALDLWLGSSRAVIEGGEVRVKGGILGLGRARIIPIEDIKGIETKIGMQHGGQSGTPYYDIQLIATSGRRVILGRYIKDKREAEWLVREVKRSLGAGV